MAHPLNVPRLPGIALCAVGCEMSTGWKPLSATDRMTNTGSLDVVRLPSASVSLCPNMVATLIQLSTCGPSLSLSHPLSLLTPFMYMCDMVAGV